MNNDDNQIMPPSVTLTLSFNGQAVLSIPVFVLLVLARQVGVAPEYRDLFNAIDMAPDHIAEGNAPADQNQYIHCLQATIPSGQLLPFLSCPPYIRPVLELMWTQRMSEHESFAWSFVKLALPGTIYRYMTYRKDRMETLLRDGRLFFPSPALFNDPFDCSFDPPMRLSMIEFAIGCFSTIADDVLMYSHYADNHRGVCIGFDSRKLVASLENKAERLRADLRPVWYCRAMPPLSLEEQPALCATCKHDIWQYEKEYRVFVVRGVVPTVSGLYNFSRDSVVEINYGCMATDDTIATCKSLMHDMPVCKHRKATQVRGEFGVKLETIYRI